MSVASRLLRIAKLGNTLRHLCRITRGRTFGESLDLSTFSFMLHACKIRSSVICKTHVYTDRCISELLVQSFPGYLSDLRALGVSAVFRPLHQQRADNDRRCPQCGRLPCALGP